MKNTTKKRVIRYIVIITTLNITLAKFNVDLSNTTEINLIKIETNYEKEN